MVSEIVKAVFAAEETISNSLNEAERATESFNVGMGKMNSQLNLVSSNSSITDDELQDFRNTVQNLGLTSIKARESIEEANDKIDNMGDISDLSSQQIENIERSIEQAVNANYRMSQSLDDVVDEQEQLIASNKIAEGRVNQFRRAVGEVVGPAMAMTKSVDAVTDATYGVAPAAKVAESAANDFEKELDDVRNSSIGAAGALGALNTVISDSILNFGSLSVNIGPFNIALRNFITQVPAILTGMGSMISLITTLIAGFGTLAVVSGALVAGGALQFFEEFSGNFEESTEAIEAMGAALKNLFIDALSPLMTDANADLFVDVVNGMAGAVNRFAQFAQQMRDEVLDVFNQVGGDADDFYNALRNAFILIEPVLVGFINFFLEDFPKILERFAVLSTNLAGDINILLNTFGMLLNQLLDLAATILAGVAPSIEILVGILSVLAAVLNMVPNDALSLAITFGIMIISGLKLIGVIAGLISGLIGLHGRLITNAAAGGILGGVYETLIAQTQVYTVTNMSLKSVLYDTIFAIKAQAVSWYQNLRAMVMNNIAVTALGKAYKGLVGWIKSTVVWMKLQQAWAWLATTANTALGAGSIAAAAGVLAEAVALGVTSAALAVYDALAWAAAGATWALGAAVAAVTSPAWGTVAVVLALISALVALAEWLGIIDITGAMSGFLDWVVDGVMDVIDAVKEFVGLTGGSLDLTKEGIADPSAIQTNANVDLSFNDELNQQVDVQADPEDREGIKRIVKDAMNEANSIARRSQGGGR